MKPTGYTIELRDKDGNLKDYIQDIVSDVSWEWNRLGGCGHCGISLKKGYRDIAFGPRDDIQIRVEGDGTESAIDPLLVALLHGDGTDASPTIIDSSGKNSPVAVGNACIDTAQSVFGGASLYIPGRTGDKITIPYHSRFCPGSSDFYIRFRIKWETVNNNDYIYSQRYDTNNETFISVQSNRLYFGNYFNGSYRVYISCPFTPSTSWQAVEISRVGNQYYMFVEGTSQTVTLIDGSMSNALGDINSDISIGAYASANGYGIQGWIDEFEFWLKAGHTSSYTPATEATSPYTTVTASTKLVYRGYIDKITPTLKVDQGINLDVYGYFNLFKKIIVHDSGDIKTYTTSDISEIVESIINIYVVPNCSITKGTIDTVGFEVDTIDFFTTVADALNTLATTAGNIEYGVDENLVFFWRTESETISHKFFVGDNIASLERAVDWSKLVNKIYLVGGEVAGAKYKKTGENTDSQASYFLSEDIINNSSITSDTVADQYIGAILSEKSNPIYNIKAKIVNTDKRLEDTLPIGVVVFYDAFHDRSSSDENIGDIVGEAADGGSDIVVGEIADGGSGVIVGGSFGAQVNRISYKLSNTPGRFNITVELGDTILETAAKIKRLEQALASIQQV